SADELDNDAANLSGGVRRREQGRYSNGPGKRTHPKLSPRQFAAQAEKNHKSGRRPPVVGHAHRLGGGNSFTRSRRSPRRDRCGGQVPKWTGRTLVAVWARRQALELPDGRTRAARGKA